MSKATELPGLIDSVVWIPADFDENGNSVESGTGIVIPRHLFNEAGWTHSAMSEKLGFPVKFRRVRVHHYDIPGQSLLRRNNNLACFLDLNIDLSDLHQFGLHFSEDDFLDEIIFVRQDGGPLQVQHMTALWAFAVLHAKEMAHFPKEEFLDRASEAKRLAAQFSPQSFAKLFEDLCAGVKWKEGLTESQLAPKWYEGIENPVVVLCGTCSKDKTTAGKALQICSKCRFRQYCSRECQVADHPRHKRYCRKS